MEHTQAIEQMQQMGDAHWGGYGPNVDSVLPEWQGYWEVVFDMNTIAILKQMASGEFDRWSDLILDKFPGAELDQAAASVGLMDSEGNAAVANYFRMRADVDEYIWA